jgi:DNA-binding transcriptional MerR regulator
MAITPPRAPPEALSITQLCRQSGATPRALRYYEAVGLLSPRRRDNQTRIYLHREKVRLELILRGRRAGFTLKEVRGLFETYDKGGRDAQRVRALPLFKERLAALTLKRAEIAGALETLKAASDRMADKLGATTPDQSVGIGESVTKRQPLRDFVSPSRDQG